VIVYRSEEKDRIRSEQPIICMHHSLRGDQLKEVGIGGVCSTHVKDKKCIQYFGWKT